VRRQRRRRKGCQPQNSISSTRSYRSQGRVGHLEAEVAEIRAGAPVGTAPRTYTVQPGDTLSGIAAAFGLDGWQRMYEANSGVIGGDPNRIYPGQVLVVP
jgi:nucleoid-associated protein YgaU